jgi:hypothetical protein
MLLTTLTIYFEVENHLKLFLLKRKGWQTFSGDFSHKNLVTPPAHDSAAGLPDGLFSNQKSKFWSILEVLAMDNSGIFMAIWRMFRTFGIVLYGTFGTFFPFWYIVPPKIWQPRSAPIFLALFGEQTVGR